MAWQEIFEAFHKFKETKNYEEFRGLGFDLIIDGISNFTKDFKKSEEEKFIIEFEEFGKCSENFFQKNIDKISLCLEDKEKCSLSKIKVLYAVFRCMPNDFGEFVVEHFDADIESVLDSGRELKEHSDNLENDLEGLKEYLKNLDEDNEDSGPR